MGDVGPLNFEIALFLGDVLGDPDGERKGILTRDLHDQDDGSGSIRRRKSAFGGKVTTSVDLAINSHIYASLSLVIHSCRSSAAKHIPRDPSLKTISFIRRLIDWPSLSYSLQQEFECVGCLAISVIIKKFYHISIALVFEPCGEHRLLIMSNPACIPHEPRMDPELTDSKGSLICSNDDSTTARVYIRTRPP